MTARTPAPEGFPLRILVVLEDLGDTGAVRVSLDRATRWQAGGDAVTVLAVARGGPDRVAVPAGLAVRVASGGRLRSALPLALFAAVRAAGSADVVVVGTEVGFALLLGRVAARLTRRPYAVTVQSAPARAVAGYVHPRLRGVTRAALRRADRLVCVSAGLLPAVADLGAGPGRAVAVPNAVDTAAVRRAAAAEPGPPTPADGVPVLVASGRLTYQKGFDLLLRAHAAALAAGAPPHRVVVLGEGDERPALERLARALGVAGSVALPGFAVNPHAVVARASAFVLPSRWEGYGLALAEALAVGTPCLAYDCEAGPAEVLAGGALGELVPAGDVGALAAALVRHLRDPGVLRARAAGAAGPGVDPAVPAAQHRAVLAALAAGAEDARAVRAGRR